MFMHHGSEILSVRQSAGDLVAQTKQALTSFGLQAIPSFDLQSACAPQGKPCPHHGVVPCACQLVILIVYDWRSQPHALSIHEFEGWSQISLLETPGGHGNRELREILRLTLRAAILDDEDTVP